VDYQLEQLINGPAGSHALLDSVMVGIAQVAAPLFLACMAFWFLVGWLGDRRTERLGAMASLAAAGVALLINQALGHLWDRPRPFVAHPGAVHLLVSHGTDSSFPSDHAAAAFAISLVLIAMHRRIGVLALLFALLMSYARVYVGDHYPGDLAGGALIGLAAGAAVIAWLQPLLAVADPWALALARRVGLGKTIGVAARL
jgi:undecaprenyl-diphosphatase